MLNSYDEHVKNSNIYWITSSFYYQKWYLRETKTIKCFFKDKCLRTVDKLNKTQISSNMILGRSHVDIKAMKNKYKVYNSVLINGKNPFPLYLVDLVEILLS